tara:strand:- start:169 stop:468 length:300 start_codon:yes stop_codon:yes gene_type:complete
MALSNIKKAIITPNGQEIVDMTDEEIAHLENEIETTAFADALENLRKKRNYLLSETDYLALSDNTMSEEMTTYRQELRDITEGLSTIEEIESVEFPTKP